MTLRRIAPIALLAVALALAVGVATANPADLDFSFGTAGKVQTDLGGDTASSDSGATVLVQPDGGIIVAGTRMDMVGQRSFTLVRYLQDGTLDPDFGIGGIATFTQPGMGNVTDAALQDDGKIAVVGFGGILIVRFNPDGTIDETFSDDGYVETINFHNPEDPDEEDRLEPYDVEMSGNNILVAGLVDYSPDYFAVTRFLPDGRIDDAFGEDGEVQTSFAQDHDQDALALAAYDDGRFLLAGRAEPDPNDTNLETFALARYKANGDPDNSFDGDGRVTTEMGEGRRSVIDDVILLDDGRIIAIGRGQLQEGHPEQGFMLARYNANGSLDTDWNGTGKLVQNFDDPNTESDQAFAGIVQPDGKVVAVGHSTGIPNTGQDMRIARYNPDGTPDLTFGIEGNTTIDFTVGTETAADAVLDADGRILVVGTTSQPGGSDIALVRLLGPALLWGDNRCAGGPDTFDAIAVLLLEEGLGGSSASGGAECPDIGQSLDTNAGELVWGDANCSDDIDPADVLPVLAYLADLNFDVPSNCPAVGDAVVID